MIRCGLGGVVGVLACAAGCGGPVATPRAAAAPPPPVLCAEYPAERQDIVSCRYTSEAQTGEVWARSKQLAATSAISLSATHIQWLSVETHLETVQGNSPVDCKMHWGGHVECNGGPYEMPVGLIAVTRFALLSAEEAAARASDPLIPAERRPIDARSLVTASPH